MGKETAVEHYCKLMVVGTRDNGLMDKKTAEGSSLTVFRRYIMKVSGEKEKDRVLDIFNHRVKVYFKVLFIKIIAMDMAHSNFLTEIHIKVSILRENFKELACMCGRLELVFRVLSFRE